MQHYKFDKKTGMEPIDIFNEAVDCLTDERHEATGVDKDALAANIVAMVKSGDLIVECDIDEENIECLMMPSLMGRAMLQAYNLLKGILPKIAPLPMSEEKDDDKKTDISET